MNNLEKALSRLVEDNEFAAPLARILLSASTRGIVSHSEVEVMVSDNLEEVLLLGNNWRLLIPVRVVKSGAWEDRLLLCRPGESYELPNIVRHLVQNASRTGCWDLAYAITEAFKEMEEPAWQQMP